MTRRVALVVNPIAGMGGRVGLKGTDGPELLRRALERGAAPVAAARAARALARLLSRAPEGVEVIAPAALLDGAAPAAPARAGSSARATGVAPVHAGLSARAADVALTDAPTPGSPAQTRATAAALAADGVDLILFAGGDGTARDVSAAVAGRVPILGIPAGVKMHSACFGATPEAAGEAAAAYLRDPRPELLVEAEIADAPDAPDAELGQSAYRSGREIDAARRAGLSTVLHGTALVPRAPGRRLGPKATSGAADGALAAACAQVAAEVDPRALTIFGPGTTTAAIERALGVEPALRGVDAFRDGALVARDASEAELLALLDAHAPAALGEAAATGRAAAPGAAAPRVHLVLGVVGGQGSLLGRGNQQLSPAVLRRIDREDITVVADRRKLLALDPPQLRVDTGDPDLDHDLSGHVRVRVSARESVMCAVAC